MDELRIYGLTFEDCCKECLKTKEFVEQFNRLKHHELNKNLSPAKVLIDKVCGYDPNKEAIPDFVNTVYDIVWTPLMMQYINELKELNDYIDDNKLRDNIDIDKIVRKIESEIEV